MPVAVDMAPSEYIVSCNASGHARRESETILTIRAQGADNEEGESMIAATVGAPELIIILVVVLLLFGASKLPQLARSLGASAKELRKGFEEDDESEEDAETEADDKS